MVACDRWESGGISCEVYTATAAELSPLSELARERVEAVSRTCRALRDADSAAGAFGDDLIDAGLGATRLSGGLLSGLLPAEAGRARTCEEARAYLPGADFDLSPIAIAWAADRIADESLSNLGIACLINLDGNRSVRGCPPPGGWQIVLEDGQPSSRAHNPIPLWGGGLASAVRPAHDSAHPTSGSWRTATVAAPSCERAKAAALTVLELGDAAPRWLTQRGLAARLVHTGGICVQTHGWAV